MARKHGGDWDASTCDHCQRQIATIKRIDEFTPKVKSEQIQKVINSHRKSYSRQFN